MTSLPRLRRKNRKRRINVGVEEWRVGNLPIFSASNPPG
jgi:hypothetical protein